MNLLYPYHKFKGSLPSLMYGILALLIFSTGHSRFSQNPNAELILRNPKLNDLSAARSVRPDAVLLTFQIGPTDSDLVKKSNLVSFTARLNKDLVKLEWATEKETNRSHYIIQRSLDGIEFEDDAIIFTAATRSPAKKYSFSDNIRTINSRSIYYRLKMVDVNGRFRYSGIVSLCLQNDFDLAGLPNLTQFSFHMGKLQSVFPKKISNNKIRV